MKMGDILLKALLYFVGISALPVILLFLFLNPDKFEHWMALFYRFLYFVSSSIPKVAKKIDGYAVASSIQDTVNSICEKINSQAPDAIPHALKIEWIKTQDVTAFVKEGKAVVCLNSFKNQDKNIVDATLMFLKVGLLPRAKNNLDSLLRKSCEFKVAAHIFSARRDTGAYSYFIQNELDPAISSEPALAKDLQLIEDIDAVGFFTHVFLTEVKQTGEKLIGTLPSATVRQEMRSFANFLRTIAMKTEFEDVPLTFAGLKIKVAVILVARRDTIVQYGVQPYINRISRCAQDGYESIYVTAWGDDFVKAIIDIKKIIEGGVVSVLRRYDYPVKGQVKGRMIVCQSNLSYLSQRRQLQEEVKIALDEIVPEIKAGEVELVGIARIRDSGCKVAVRMVASTANGSDAVRKCIGTRAERINELKLKLGDKFVALIPWSDDIREYITNALHPLKAEDIIAFQIDEENLIASVTVKSDVAYKKAVGFDNNNVKLSSDLTGWVINVVGPKSSKIMQTPEDELREILNKKIPELMNDDLEIVRLVRIKGIGSRVIVRWARNGGTRRLASEICRGLNHAVVNSVREEFGERLFFHEWFDAPERQIVSCLYPLREYDVSSINLDDSQNIATISLNPCITSAAHWRDQYNLTLTERITGWRIEITD